MLTPSAPTLTIESVRTEVPQALFTGRNFGL